MQSKTKNILSFLVLLVLLFSCTSTKNTTGTRWYHSFNTRYNVYFNGNEAYKEALKALQEGYQESYSEMILMFPESSLPKEKTETGGAFDRAIEKAGKAIKTHSIQTKPEKQSGKSRDPKYQEFMNRTEYNPFLHNAWMLMGKSQFYNGDFLVAASTFSYISRLYASQPEISLNAKIWQARSYAELEWFYEAENILTQINNDKLPPKLNNWFSAAYADLLIKQKHYQEAVPYLQIAVKAEKNKRQRARQKYLLGQVYTRLGQNELAYKTFGEVSGASAPYILEFSAKIRQTEVYSGSDRNKVIKQLNKMSKSSKNKDYLDQVYYAMGNIYMNIPDTVKAIESYEKGVEKSTQSGIDKALNQIRLGDIYFQQRKYLKAQPNYSEALGLLKKEDEAYPRVSKRSEVLDELVIHFTAVELQDSLQRLSRMSEDERLAVVNKIIEELIKKEKEEAEKAEREEYLTKREEERMLNQTLPAGGQVQPPSNQKEGSFYFYNAQAVAQGKAYFQKNWGRRKLEDNWRRTNKTNPLAEWEENSLENEADTTEIGNQDLAENTDELAPELSSDPKDPQFYLQQIPVTEEDIAASNLIIIDGLFNMGLIYKDKLEDADLALETFETLNNRFPTNEHKLEAYYQIYLIYWRQNNMAMAELYKSKIRAEFSNSNYAIAMADPDYEYNLKMTEVIQDSLYKATYEAYFNGNIREIRDNYETVSTKYNQSKLMPKFMFLNALSYAQTNDSEKFKELLKEMIEKYPETDVSLLAAEMMKGFLRGLLLSNSGDNMLARGGLFNIRFNFEGDSLLMDTTLTFKEERNLPHELLLVFPIKSIDENMLLFTVASYNFGNFMINDFGLEKSNIGEAGLLRIQGFNNLDEVLQYLGMINQPGIYGQELDEYLIKIPISVDNLNLLMKGRSIDEYMQFFEKQFSSGNEKLILKWKLQKEEELEEITTEIPKTENTEDSQELPKEELPEENIQEDVPEIQEVEMETDTLSVIASDTIQLIPEKIDEAEKIEIIEEKQEEDSTLDSEKILDSATQGMDEMDKVKDSFNEVMEDPVRGIQNLFKRREKSDVEKYIQQQEKEEKEHMKQEEDERKALQKQREQEEKELLKAKEKQERDLAKMKEAERKRLEEEKKQQLKAKEQERKNTQKLKEQERKDREKQREIERKEKEKARKEAEKIKNQERKEREKQRELERKQKEAERKEAQKLKDQERKEKEKQRELERKQKEAERKAKNKR